MNTRFKTWAAGLVLACQSSLPTASSIVRADEVPPPLPASGFENRAVRTEFNFTKSAPVKHYADTLPLAMMPPLAVWNRYSRVTDPHQAVVLGNPLLFAENGPAVSTTPLLPMSHAQLAARDAARRSALAPAPILYPVAQQSTVALSVAEPSKMAADDSMLIAQEPEREYITTRPLGLTSGNPLDEPYSKVGFLDNAILRNRFRIRYDSAYGVNQPDRAEYFWAKSGWLRSGFEPDAEGPPLAERRVDYQEAIAYGEVMLREWISGFVELPFRYVNPSVNDNEFGVGDLRAGLRVALLASDNHYYTAQLRVYTATGNAHQGLGTGHTSLEPALLIYQRLGERLTFEAELKDWITLQSSDYTGNVISYGAGLGYDLIQRSCWRLALVGETLGWTVLSGQKTDITPPVFPTDAAGDTILNASAGLRWSRGDQSVYLGYGRSILDNVWYRDIARLEYRYNF